MSIFSRYSLYPGRIGDLLLRQLTAASISSGNTVAELKAGGNLDRAAVITAYADPVSRFSSPDIQTLIAGTPGLSLTAGYATDTANTPPGSGAVTASNLLQHQKRVDGGTFEAAGGGAHFLITSTKGYAQLDELTLTQDAVDGVSADISLWHLSSDGIAVPAVPTNGQALTSTGLWTAQWYLGPVTLGDPASSPVLLKSVQSVRIRTGITYVTKRADGHVFAAVGSIIDRKPEIRIMLRDLSEWYTKLTPTLHGQALTGVTRINCYLQKGIHGGTRVPYATAQHMNIYAATGAMHNDSISVSGDDDVGYELVIRPTGTLALANNVAILVA